jgi:hypothetical protein
LVNVFLMRASASVCRDHHLAGQLSPAPLGIGHRGKRHVLLFRRGEIDIALGGLEAERLRPDLVLAGRQRREIVVAGLVGVDRRRNGRAFEPGGDCHPAELLARGRGDGAAQELIVSLSKARRCQTDDHRSRARQ